MGFTELTHPHVASNLPGYRGYCPQLKYECGHTYGIATDKLTTRHTRNEKLRTIKLDDPKLREPFLPQPNGDNKLTANMVPGYTGYVPSVRFLYGSRYKEATEQAVSNFNMKDGKYRSESDELKKTVYSTPTLKTRADFQDPTMYPDLKPRYSKNYFPSEQREFCEPPLPGYTGYVPRRREHDLGTRYAVWTKGGFTDSLTMRHKQENLATQRIDVTRIPEATVKVSNIEHGTLYKTFGMKPKYTGYIPLWGRVCKITKIGLG
ncbi:Protein FAM166B [Exaiptasia diaphana]|nr:Protein FAM166B [Exaiptasia diaphana]